MTTHFQHTTRGLVITGNPTFEEFQEWWECLETQDDLMPFVLGDALLWGFATYGEMTSQVYRVGNNPSGHFSIGTLRNYKRVAKAWIQERRVYNLSWSHYDVTAGLDVELQDDLMSLAIAKNLSRDALRDLKYEMGIKDNAPSYPQDATFEAEQRNHNTEKERDEALAEIAQLRTQPPAESSLLPLPSTGPDLTELDWTGLLQIKDILIDNDISAVTIHSNGDITWHK